MASPTSSAPRARSLTPLGPRPHLARGLRYEQAGVAVRAIESYEAALRESVTPVERAEAHIGLARVHRTLSDWDAAIREASTAARLADEEGNGDLAAEAMNVEVGVHQLRGEFRDGERLAQRALAKAASPRVRGILLQNLGAIAAQRRDFRIAERYFSQSVDAFTAARYEIGIALALNNASAAARDAGDFERSLELATLAAEVASRIDALDTAMLALQNQAHALLELGSVARAESILNEPLGHYAATKNALRYAECLEIMGRIHEWTPGYVDSAGRCYRLALALAEKVNDRELAARLRSRLARMDRPAA
jgi:tetratricopeptide (TPR) repeat protein